MRIQAVGNSFNRNVKFGNFSTDGDDETPRYNRTQRPKNFYDMSNSDKLDKIYDMLKEQKQDMITLSRNQRNMYLAERDAHCKMSLGADAQERMRFFYTSRDVNVIY